MRISTSMIYDQGVARMQQQTADWLKTQQQAASGRRILSPQDDPVGATRVLEISQFKALNQQYDVNIGSANDTLGLEDTVLDSVSELIRDVRTTAISAGAPGVTGSQLTSMATALRGRFNELMGLANSRDGSGRYMFSGHQAVVPFTGVPGAVVYGGDAGQRLIQVSPTRQIDSSDAGAGVFQNPGADVFGALGQLIADIEAAAPGMPGSQPALAANLSADVALLDSGLGRILQVRASVGTRMQEIAAIKLNGEDTALQYDTTLSRLQDFDYAKGLSDLARQQAGLEAAQKTFVKIQGLSLFNYL